MAPGFKLGTSIPDDLQSESLTSSRGARQRLLQWSGSSEREHLHAMRFHNIWGHRECPVMAWYTLHSSSSTRFRTMEHRRSVDGPFFHEFLVILLTDGSACRVERMGDGSRADAVRTTGCAAHDLIQWFPPEVYAEFASSNPSILLAEIDLCRECDILDVLAVCYSVQNTKMCSVYTLQRYNCYFFCWTIITILTRRIARWEDNIPASTWDSSLTALFDSVAQWSPEVIKLHLAFRLCVLLDPKSPNPFRFVLQALRVSLGSHSGVLARVHAAFAETLWHSNWGHALNGSLADQIKAVASHVLENESTCGRHLRSALYDSEDQVRQISPSYKMITKVVLAEATREVPKYISEAAQNLSNWRRMLEVEHPIPLRTRMLHSLASPLLGLLIMFSNRQKPNDRPSIVDKVVRSSVRAMLAFTKLAIAGSFGLLLDERIYGKIYHDSITSVGHDMRAKILQTTLDKLESQTVLDASDALVVFHSWMNENTFSEWLESFVIAILEPSLQNMLQVQGQIGMRTEQTDHEAAKEITNVIELQNAYIRQRIQAHATRVAAHQLAAAPLVFKDVEETMNKVWTGMPPGLSVGIGPN